MVDDSVQGSIPTQHRRRCPVSHGGISGRDLVLLGHTGLASQRLACTPELAVFPPPMGKLDVGGIPTLPQELSEFFCSICGHP